MPKRQTQLSNFFKPVGQSDAKVGSADQQHGDSIAAAAGRVCTLSSSSTEEEKEEAAAEGGGGRRWGLAKCGGGCGRGGARGRL